MGQDIKFPRLVKYYKPIIRTASSHEEAEALVKRILAEKTTIPLDIAITVFQVRDNFYEAQLNYLPQDCEKYLSTIENKWRKGIKSTVLFVDKNPDELEALIKITRDTGFYDITTVLNPIEVVPRIRTEAPELLVVRHELREKTKGTEVLQSIRQAGIKQKAVVHGSIEESVAIENYRKLHDVCYFLYNALDYEIAQLISLTLNGVLPKNESQFFIHHLSRNKE